MLCPKCHQPTSYDSSGRGCALCGFDLLPLQSRLRVLYLVSFALFASTLIYGGLVYYFETQSPLPQTTTMPVTLPFIFLVVAVIVFGIAVNVGALIGGATSPGRVQMLWITQLCLAESIAIYGLVLYLVGHSLLWFTTFLGLSWLAFLWIGSGLPKVVRKMSELAVVEARSGGGKGSVREEQ